MTMQWKDVLSGKGTESNRQLEEEFALAILASERIRSTILCVIFTIGLVLVILLPLINPFEYEKIFKVPEFTTWLLGLFGFGAVYEFMVRNVLTRLIKARRAVPEFARYGNAVLEVSIITIALIAATQAFATPVYALLSPAVLGYFLLIVLSTLRLDLKLCIFTGFVAALEHTLLAFWCIEQSRGVVTEPIIISLAGYISKGMVMLVGGGVAGFVALQIKQRVFTIFGILEERNQIVGLFGQQVSPSIVDELLKQNLRIDSRRQYVCVMFLDIRDFTPFAEKHTPEEIVAYLNTLFSSMIESITRHNGIINQFVGDGFMATFGAPVSAGNDCTNAVNAAKEILTSLGQLNREGSIPHTGIGIGIHAGIAVTGNVGSSLRQQYSITGDVVILASRIEQLNKQFQSQLLVSHEVWSAIGEVDDAFSIGSVQVKGHEEPIYVYKLA